MNMKPVTINVQITKCPKQYEAVRLGLDATLEPDETVESAIKAATAQLNAIYAEMYTPKPKVAQNEEKPATNAKEKPKRELITLTDPRTQQIIAKMEREPERADELYEKTHEYYEPDADAEKALQVAVLLNKRLIKNKNKK